MMRDACANAAEDGHLEVLKYLREEVKAPWDWNTAAWAAENGHLHILEYLVERKFDEYDEYACELAAKYGHLDCLKYLHETAKAPWDDEAVRERTEQPHRMCTIPPRQQLSSPTRLAIRRRRVTACRIRIRIRIITPPPSSIKPPRPRTTPLERNTEQTPTHPPQKFPLCTHTTLILKHAKRKSKRERRETKHEGDVILEELFLRSLLASSRWCSALSNACLLKLKLFHFGQHDGRVRKFLRYDTEARNEANTESHVAQSVKEILQHAHRHVSDAIDCG